MTSDNHLESGIPMVVASVQPRNYDSIAPSPIIDGENVVPAVSAFHSSMAPEALIFVTIDGDAAAIDEATPLVPSDSSLNRPLDQPEGGQSGPEKTIDGPVFRDWPFAVLFYVHIAAMVYVGVVYSTAGYHRIANDYDFDMVKHEIEKNDDVNPQDMAQLETFVEEAYAYLHGYPQRIVLYSVLPTAVLLLVVTDMILAWCLLKCTRFWVTKTLLGSASLTVVAMVALVIAVPSVFVVILACIVIGASVYFTWSVWSIIPFLSVNLKIALEGMRSNMGTYMWALLLSDISSFFVLAWFYVLFGVSFYESLTCEDRMHPDEKVHLEGLGKTDPDECSMNGWTFVLLLLSLFWTTSVIGNLSQVVVAGVMATWLYDKDEARGCCSAAIWGSLHRGMTYSFGSICLGSLVQNFVSVLRWMTKGGRTIRQDPSRADHACCSTPIVECVADLCGDFLDYFTQWNYIYVALYGFPFVESGKRVTQMLKTKGFVSTITERLAGFVLGWVTFTMGLWGGAAVLVVERIVTMRNPDPLYESYVYGPMPYWRVAAFLYVSRWSPIYWTCLVHRFM
jgi:Plasma-membrane choline transporter